LVAGPYIAILGNLTNKPTGQAVIGVARANIEDRRSSFSRDGIAERDESRSAVASRQNDLPSSILNAQPWPWAVWWHGDRDGDWLEHLAWGAWAVTAEVIRSFAYLGLLPTVLGLYWFRGQWRNRPETWGPGILCMLQVLVLCRVGLVVGYVSERHVLIIVLCGLYWAVWAMLELPRRWPALSRHSTEQRGPRWSTSLLAIFMLGCLPVCLQPLHANQIGHREAGLWLAQHARSGDLIVDPFDWSSLYSGWIFQNEPLGPGSSNPRPVQYVVLEATQKPHPELILLPEAKKLAADGQLVFDWQPNRCQLKHKAQEVQIFKVPFPSQ
jgi:hypothetical protein